jgi:hypothetical protein
MISRSIERDDLLQLSLFPVLQLCPVIIDQRSAAQTVKLTVAPEDLLGDLLGA